MFKKPNKQKKERNSAPHYVTTSKQGDSWPALQMSEREREMLAQIEYLKLQNAQLQAQNSKDTEIGKVNDTAPAQTSSNTAEQQSVEAYNVNNTKQAHRPYLTQSEIKEPLLESSESHSKTNRNTCCCAFFMATIHFQLLKRNLIFGRSNKEFCCVVQK
ncbi:hypothetical protein RFI_02381 [Reticulomyxa filosa]|uniref:Uncharacterized protein n=1 Tax=Reticulomyxa filosa TaxID=46433 RepID=X6P951_RETFI|nr:hypothetical protein RFI_02381 [Reticulomyxa filosa]|eukprot:ETO34711.1 hypothetical protein RFI_02381 [Reticulomyxa filosa]